MEINKSKKYKSNHYLPRIFIEDPFLEFFGYFLVKEFIGNNHTKSNKLFHRLKNFFSASRATQSYFTPIILFGIKIK